MAKHLAEIAPRRSPVRARLAPPRFPDRARHSRKAIELPAEDDREERAARHRTARLFRLTGSEIRLTVSSCGPSGGPRSTLASPLAFLYAPVPPTTANVLVVPGTSVSSPAAIICPAS